MTDDLEVKAAIARVLEGDVDSYSLVVTTFQKRAFGVAYALLRDRDDAEDAAQEAFVRAFKALSRFDRSRPFLPWLMRIVYNTAKTHYTRRKRRIGREVAYAAPCDAPIGRLRRDCPRADGEHPMIEASREGDVTPEERYDLYRAIDGLPVRLSEAVRLYYLSGFSVQETAQILGVSEESVKSRLFRARKKIAEQLQPDHPTESTT